MTWILTAVLCIILVEVMVRAPLQSVISEISTVARKALHVLGAKSVSDHWKEKVILAYAGSLFMSTIKLAGLLVAIGAIAILLLSIFEYSGVRISDFITSWTGILFSLLVAMAYYTMRKFFA